MSDFYITLHRATAIKRSEDGIAYSWEQGKLLQSFDDALAFLDYVRANTDKLKNVIAFSGSATVISGANAFIASELRKVEG